MGWGVVSSCIWGQHSSTTCAVSTVLLVMQWQVVRLGLLFDSNALPVSVPVLAQHTWLFVQMFGRQSCLQ